eukprot:scaffold240605_cov47-Attheya_sp.AAC.1
MAKKKKGAAAASSQWATKLKSRLEGLADGSSRESVQSLSTWLAFNRRHGGALVPVLTQAIQDAATPVSRKLLYLSVVHEALLADHPTSTNDTKVNDKWDKKADFRVLLGETLVNPAIESVALECQKTNDTTSMEVIRDMVAEWGAINAFGGPTIISSIRRTLESTQVVTTTTNTKQEQQQQQQEEPAEEDPVVITSDETPAPTTTEPPATSEDPTGVIAVATSDSSPQNPKEETQEENVSQSKNESHVSAEELSQEVVMTQKEDDETSLKELGGVVKKELAGLSDDISPAVASISAMTTPTKAATATATTDVVVDFDFEAENIAARKVPPVELLVSCKSIATTQIARELRNDTAVQLSSVLSKVPKDLYDKLKLLENEDDKKELVMSGPSSLSDDILDLDVEDAIQTVQSFRDIIAKQQEARRACIQLLIASRCQFGATQVATEFHELQHKATVLETQKLTLSDAMELEGLDFEQIDDDHKNENDETRRTKEANLPPLS